MKSTTLPILIFCFIGTVVQAQSQYDSILCYTKIDETWQNSSRSTHLRNAAGLETEIIYEIYNSLDLVWEYFQKTEKEYNGNGDPVKSTQQKWESNDWTNSAEQEFIYNTNSALEEVTSKAWSVTNQSWIPENKVIYSYNNDQLISTITYQVYDSIVLDWGNVNRVVYHYSGGMQDETLNEIWDENLESWETAGRTINIYQGSDLIQELNQGMVLSMWIDVSKYENEYTIQGKLSSKTFSLYLNSAWTPSQRNLYQYNDNGDETENISQNWDAVSDTWINGYFQLLTNYNPDGTVHQFFSNNLWSQATQQWEVGSRCDYIYNTTSTLIPVINTFNCALTNPLREDWLIYCDNIENNNPLNIKLSDLQGKLLLDENTLQPFRLTLINELPAGLYNLQITSDTNLFVQKIAIVK